MRLARDVVLSIPFAVAASFALLIAAIGLVTASRFGPVLPALAQMAASGVGLAYFWATLQRHRRQKRLIQREDEPDRGV